MKTPDKKSLQLRYIIDDAGNKTEVILSLHQFDKLFEQMAKLAALAEDNKKSASNVQSKENKTTTTVVESDSKYHLEQEIPLLKQHSKLLENMLGDLRQYKNLRTEVDRKLKLQRVVASMETELQNTKNRIRNIANRYRETTTKSATLHHVPPLPANLVKRDSPFSEIKTRLLAASTDKHRPPLVIRAQSGMGKSVMASVLAHDVGIQHAFEDGIFWHSLRIDANVLAHQVALLQELGDKSIDILQIEDGSQRLREMCTNRACLVILDDVWDTQDILPFDKLGERCQLLITTSDNNLLDVIQYFISTTKGYELKPFSKGQAMKLFINHVGQKRIADSSVDIEDIVRASDYLPLAIKLIANIARIQPPSSWNDLLERLRDEDYEFSDKYPRALMQALHLNVEALGEPADCYLALAVFSDYSHIPQSVVVMLWRFLYQLLDDKSHTLIDELADKGLLHIKDVSSQRYLSLHSFQHDYLCAESELDKLHGHLLAAYRRQCDQHGWINGPNDGYFFESLCMHLYHAGRLNELKLLLLDFNWMQNKLQATTVHALLTDYEWLEDNEIRLIKKTLFDAAVVLITDKQELANQILDRLWYEKNLKNNRDIQELLNQAKEASKNWREQAYFPDAKKKI